MRDTPANHVVFQALEKWAPKNKAYEWDNVGLQVGSNNRKATKVLVTLDVLESVVDEAIENKVSLIIAHHPLLFKPLKQLNTDTPQGRTISKLLSHDITVYASHTNLDVVEGGVNDMLAERLELNDVVPLAEFGNEKLYKFAIYVPVTHREAVKEAIGAAGGGKQGEYTHCSFEVSGTGSFKPSEMADPYIGKSGELTEVDEVKIESLIEENDLKQVLASALQAHPYEEPAYDILELENKGASYGLGRIGSLNTSMKLASFIEFVKEKLGLPYVRVVGNKNKEIKKVAVLGGSGEKYIHAAKRMKADVYITGDMTFHLAQEAMEMGLTVIDAGHYIEEILKEHVTSYLQKELDGYSVDVISSKINTNPFQYL